MGGGCGEMLDFFLPPPKRGVGICVCVKGELVSWREWV